MTTVTRFAPSPTGPLHLGHALAAITAFDCAKREAGRFLLRIEDLDPGRSRELFVQAMFEDLAWLGLSWELPVRRQSEHFETYADALVRLDARELVYPCFCTRKEIEAEAAAAASAPHGPLGLVYPGTCRALTPRQRERKLAGEAPYVLRLDMARAITIARTPLTFVEEGLGPAGERGLMTVDPAPFGDIVLARKDTPASYHLCVVVDDAVQGVTLVTRGNDLFPATGLHRLLQGLLDLPEPRYRHHRLILDGAGRRLAKRDAASTLRALRNAGKSPEDIRALLRD